MYTKRRFYYNHSPIYGWCVYDRELGGIPAYAACHDMLPMEKCFDGYMVAESPVMLENEYIAMNMCRRLNAAHLKNLRDMEVAQ